MLVMSVNERMDFVNREISEVCAIVSTKESLDVQIRNSVYRSMARIGGEYFVKGKELIDCRFLRFIRTREYAKPELKKKLKGLGETSILVLDVVSGIMDEKGI